MGFINQLGGFEVDVVGEDHPTSCLRPQQMRTHCAGNITNVITVCFPNVELFCHAHNSCVMDTKNV